MLVGTAWCLEVEVEIEHARVLHAIRRMAGVILGNIRLRVRALLGLLAGMVIAPHDASECALTRGGISRGRSRPRRCLRHQRQRRDDLPGALKLEERLRHVSPLSSKDKPPGCPSG